MRETHSAFLSSLSLSRQCVSETAVYREDVINGREERVSPASLSLSLSHFPTDTRAIHEDGERVIERASSFEGASTVSVFRVHRRPLVNSSLCDCVIEWR